MVCQADRGAFSCLSTGHSGDWETRFLIKNQAEEGQYGCALEGDVSLIEQLSPAGQQLSLCNTETRGKSFRRDRVYIDGH